MASRDRAASRPMATWNSYSKNPLRIRVGAIVGDWEPNALMGGGDKNSRMILYDSNISHDPSPSM